MARKEDFGINVGVDGQTWQGLMALTQMGPPYREEKQQLANLSSGKNMAQMREVSEEYKEDKVIESSRI